MKKMNKKELDKYIHDNFFSGNRLFISGAAYKIFIIICCVLWILHYIFNHY